MSERGQASPPPFPPTTTALLRDETHPYFLWWTEVTVGELHRLLVSPSLETRAYWMGALLREANTRDVWLFVTPEQIRDLWPHLTRYLGRGRALWAYLLGLDETPWPPPGSRDE